MRKVAIDASVVIKWFVPERDHEAARQLRDAYLDGHIEQLVAPSLLPYEVVNGLRFHDYVSHSIVEEVAEVLSGYGISITPFRELSNIVGIAFENQLTVYDAAYVALLDRVDCLYTADQAIVNVSPSVDGAIVHINDYDEIDS